MEIQIEGEEKIILPGGLELVAVNWAFRTAYKPRRQDRSARFSRGGASHHYGIKKLLADVGLVGFPKRRKVRPLLFLF